MNNYALAELVSSVDHVDARKRLQKCIFLLQEAGCGLDAAYYLHLYGPYSRDVSSATDLLVSEGILEEKRGTHELWGVQYSYRVTDDGRNRLKQYKETSDGQREWNNLQPFMDKFAQLAEEDLWILELASTMGFFFRHKGLPWPQAKIHTRRFKNVSPARVKCLDEAEKLARDAIGGGA